MDEYPKHIIVGGVTVTVQDAAEEARWLKPGLSGTAVVNAQEPEPEPEPEPAADVAPEPLTAPKKKRTAKKK